MRAIRLFDPSFLTIKDVGFNYECIPILHTNTLALIHTLEHFAS